MDRAPSKEQELVELLKGNKAAMCKLMFIIKDATLKKFYPCLDLINYCIVLRLWVHS